MTCDFQQCGILTQRSQCSLLLGLETPNDVRSVAQYSLNLQATSKGSDQTAHMRRLIGGFAGRTYHIVGNFMSRLVYTFGPADEISVYISFAQKSPINTHMGESSRFQKS